MTAPAGPEEVREPDFEAARDRAIGNIQFYGDPKNRPLTANEMRCLNDARAYVSLQARVEEVEARRLKFDIALQSLTAMGSEFVNNPERCVAYVKERQLSQHELIKRSILEAKAATRERDEALSRLAKLEQERGNG